MAVIRNISLIQEDVEPGRSQVPLSKDNPSYHVSFKTADVSQRVGGRRSEITHSSQPLTPLLPEVCQAGNVVGNQQGSHRIGPLARELVLSRIGHPGLAPVGRGGRRDEVAGEARSVGSGDGEHCGHRVAWHGGDGWERLGQHPTHSADICTS